MYFLIYYNIQKHAFKDNLIFFFFHFQSLSTQQIVYMAVQIIRGVQFLHKKRTVHKDVTRSDTNQPVQSERRMLEA